ncbi:MAG: hypothetical protein Q8O55_11405 [Dehalococcoidales bacterium]|nr:hypothetical protein [Dehalococcoidales bacterium]
MANLELVLRLKDEASKQLVQANQKIQANAKNIKALGIGLSVYGAASMLFFKKAATAAEEERVGIMKLSAVLKNVGVDYDTVSKSLEKNILVTQRKTGIGDSQQRDMLGQLIIATGDYTKSLEFLPLALDLAAASGKSANTVALALGRAIKGDAVVLKTYGIELEAGASSAAVFAAVQKSVGGTAEASASSIKIMEAELGDLMEEIGKSVLPAMKMLFSALQKAIDLFRAIPEPIRNTMIMTIAITGALAAMIGPVLLLIGFLPQLAIGITLVGVAIKAAMGPVGWIMIALSALVALASATGIMGKIFGGGGGGAKIPAMAEGGIVTRPTLALIGEHGPEAVTPLGRGAGNVTVNISSNAFMGSESEARAWARKIAGYIRDTNRTTATGRLA